MQNRTIEISNKEYKQLKEKSKIYDTVVEIRNLVASVELGAQYGCLALKNLPNIEIDKLAEWISIVGRETINWKTQLEEYKKDKYCSGSEKNNSKAKDLIKELKNTENNKPTRNEYEDKLKKIDEQLAFLSDKSVSLSEQVTGFSDEISKNERLMQSLINKRKEIIENGFIEDTEETNFKEDEDQKVTKEEKNEEIFNKKTPINIENEKEIRDEIKNIQNNKKSKEAENKNKEKKKNNKINNLSKKTLNGDTVQPEIENNTNNFKNEGELKDYLVKNQTRINSAVDAAYKNIQETGTTVLCFIKEGFCYEKHASVTPSVVLMNNGRETATLSTNLILQSSSEEEARKREINKWSFSDNLLKIFTIESGELIYSPLNFLGTPSFIYGKRQAFPGFTITENTIVSMYTDFYILQTSKSRISTQNKYKDYSMPTRQRTIETINSMSRSVMGLYNYMKEDFLRECKTIQFDETKFNCPELKRTCYLWSLVPGKHEELQGIIYYPGTGRSSDDFLDLINYYKYTRDDVALKNINTDGFSAYFSGIETLSNWLARDIRHALCMVHLRREFLKALDSIGLNKIYKRAITETDKSDKKFEDVVNIIANEEKKDITDLGGNFLFATYCIDLILRLDSDFAIADKETIEERRQKFSSKLFDKFYEIIDILYNKNKDNIKVCKSNDGGAKYKRIIKTQTLKAIVYALNNKNNLSKFLEDGDIETHNNSSELGIRSAVLQRSVMYFLRSFKGYKAYAIGLSLILSAIKIGVNPYDYFHWLFAQIKLEAAKLASSSSERKTSREIIFLPREVQIQNENGDIEVIDIFDDRYEYFTDLFGDKWRLFTPYVYKKLLESELQKLDSNK